MVGGEVCCVEKNEDAGDREDEKVLVYDYEIVY